DSNNVVKYLMFFFKIFEIADYLITRTSESNQEDNALIDDFYSQLTFINNEDSIAESNQESFADFSKKKLSARELHKEIQLANEIDQTTKSKEKSIQLAIEENKILLNDILQML